MHPVICKIGPFTIYSYGFMLVAAFFSATLLAGLRAKEEKINPQIIFNFTFLVFICGVLGSRIFYVIENLGYYLKNPLEIIILQHGGLSWFGGLILGAFAGIAYLKKRKIPVYRILDLIVPFLALAQAIGRIGCFLNGCCFGREWVPVPAQALSSLILILIFIILRFLQERPHKEGAIFFTYLILYSLKRFFIEFLRADNAIIFWGLTLFQFISILVFIFSAAKLFLIRKSR